MALSGGKVTDFIEDLLGEPVYDFGAKAFGLASSDFLVEFVKAQGWAGTAGDEIIQAVAGGLMAKYGDKLHDQVPNVGRGILLALVGRIVRENVAEPIFGKSIATSYYQKYQQSPTPQNKTALLEYYKKHPKCFNQPQRGGGGIAPGKGTGTPDLSVQDKGAAQPPLNVNLTPIDYQVGR